MANERRQSGVPQCFRLVMDSDCSSLTSSCGVRSPLARSCCCYPCSLHSHRRKCALSASFIPWMPASAGGVSSCLAPRIMLVGHREMPGLSSTWLLRGMKEASEVLPEARDERLVASSLHQPLTLLSKAHLTRVFLCPSWDLLGFRKWAGTQEAGFSGSVVKKAATGVI